VTTEHSRYYVVALVGENKAEWECPKGHHFKAKLIRKKRGIPLPGATAQQMFASWWSRERGGVNSTCFCPTCKRAEP
jgi:hypothetical protein